MDKHPDEEFTRVDYEALVEERRLARAAKMRNVSSEMYPLEKVEEMETFPSSEGEEIAILGGPTEAVDRELAYSQEERSRRRRIVCRCGHTAACHDTGGFCYPGRIFCRCKEVVPFLEPDDARPFRFSSSGSGPRHALTKGIRKMQINGGNARLLVPRKCDRCVENTKQLIPVFLSREGQPTNDPSGWTMILCNQCVELTGIPILYFDPI